MGVEMERLLLIALLFVPIFMLGACSDASQTGKAVDVNITFDIRTTTGAVTINPGLDLATTAGDSTQDSAAIAEATPTFTIPIAQQGGTAVAEGVLDNIESKQDNTQENVGNPVTDNSVIEYPSIPVLTPEKVKFEPNDLEGTPLKWSEDRKRMVQHLKHPVSYYGTPIVFKFSGSGCDGETYTLKEHDPIKRGSTSFTLISKNGDSDDGVFFSDPALSGNAEVLGPRSCTEGSKVMLHFTKSGQ